MPVCVFVCMPACMPHMCAGVHVFKGQKTTLLVSFRNKSTFFETGSFTGLEFVSYLLVRILVGRRASGMCLFLPPKAPCVSPWGLGIQLRLSACEASPLPTKSSLLFRQAVLTSREEGRWENGEGESW